MSRYFDADAVMEVLERSAKDPRNETAMTSWANAFQELIDLLDDTLIPIATADVVEVVRCKDCKWLDIYKINGEDITACNNENAFFRDVRCDEHCSCGERREDDDN